MNKKVLIFFLFLVLVVIGELFFYQKMQKGDFLRNQTEADLKQLVSDSAKLESIVKNNVVNVEVLSAESDQVKFTSVILKNGVGEYVIDSENNLKGDVFLNSILGQTPTSDGYDVFTDLAINAGGTGIFHSVAIFHLSSTTMTHISSGDLGDRIKALSASVSPANSNDYELTVKYLDRKDDEPMTADPTVQKEKKFKVVDHKIVK